MWVSGQCLQLEGSSVSDRGIPAVNHWPDRESQIRSSIDTPNLYIQRRSV